MTNKKPLSDWLIVSDIDGTLNNKLRQLPERNKLAIERFVAEGGHFTLASGRNPQSMERHFRSLPIAGTPAVVINCAGIYDFSKNEMVFFSPMSDEGMRLAVEAAKKFPLVDVIVVAKDTIYITARVGSASSLSAPIISTTRTFVISTMCLKKIGAR